MRKFSLVLALILMISAFALGNAEDTYFYDLGDTMEDFEITTYDGTQTTLNELLENYEMVLINMWATWCGPCRVEFPCMEEAYEEYSDKVAVVAISVEPTDDDATLKAFTEEYGLTFLVGRDEGNLYSHFAVDGIPTTCIVDRFGVVCFIECGSMPDVSSFELLFETFTGDDYEESKLLDELPRLLPQVEPASDEEISAALNAEGASLSFTNSPDEYDWPMLPAQKDGRSVVYSSNTGYNSSSAVVVANIEASAGDVISIIFKLSSESGYDPMHIYVDGDLVKTFSGEKDWMSYALEISEDGDHELVVSYDKDEMESAGDDTLWIDTIALLSGDAAAEALSLNPVYARSDETKIAVLNENAREIVIDDVSGDIEAYFGGAFYLTGDEDAVFEIFIDADVDPEGALVYFDCDGSMYTLAELYEDGRFIIANFCDSLEETGYSYSDIYLYIGSEAITVTYFKSEENINAFVADFADEDGNVSVWTYADGTLPSTDELPAGTVEAITEAYFLISYVDQNGDPVPGAVCQVCNDTTCVLYTTDENGLCEFTLEPFEWEIHTLMLPKGYTGDTETITYSSLGGGEYVFTVTKN